MINSSVVAVLLAGLPMGVTAQAAGFTPLLEPNRGQADPPSRFLLRGGSSTVFLRDSEIIVAGRTGSRSRLTIRFRNVSNTARPRRPEPREQTAGRVSYLRGDRSKWIPSIPLYRSARYRALYPGIDVLVHTSPDALFEYDFVVHPKADPGRIRIELPDANRITLTTGGDLIASSDDIEYTHLRPIAFQEAGGQRRPVSCSYVRLRGNAIGVRVGSYDRDRTLVIDPVVTFSGSFGSAANTDTMAVVADPNGNTYLAGSTESADLRAGSGAARAQQDAFVMKLDRTGQPVYVTYLGGGGTDRALAIAVDARGAAFIAGSTTSVDFPVSGGFRGRLSGRSDAFVAALDPAGSSVLYSMYLGGSDADYATGMVVHSTGEVSVAGVTSSPDFPVANALQPQFRGGVTDAFVARFNASGSAMVFGTYLGGTSRDEARAMAAASSGELLVAGATWSTDFSVVNPVQRARAGREFSDAFVSKLSSNGSSLVWSTYLGGSEQDAANAVAVDSASNIYIGGATSSSDFPVRSAPQDRLGARGYSDGFVAMLNASGQSLAFSTYLGGNSDDEIASLALSSSGEILVTGSTGSRDFPAMRGLHGLNSGMGDAFLTRLGPAGALTESTFLGGELPDTGKAVAISADGTVTVAGLTSSPGFPTFASPWRSGAGVPASFVAGITPAALVSASAASFVSDTLAPESMAVLGGPNLANATAFAAALPLSTNLGGTSVTMIDSAGAERAAPLIYVSPTQINYLVPSGTAPGFARVRVRTPEGRTSETTVNIRPVAPAIFAANENGKGVAAAIVVRSLADGPQSFSFAFSDDPPGSRRAVPINLGPPSDRVFVSLFGTGIRGVESLDSVTVRVGDTPVPVLSAGAQPQFPGLDQVNIFLPRTLAGAGEAPVVVSVNGRKSNAVTLRIR